MPNRIIPFALMISTLFLAGCLRFGPDADTEKPDKDQVDRCRSLFGISPELKIKPLGYKAVYGIDNAIWFKFSCDSGTTRILGPKEGVMKMHGEGNALPDMESKWWDIGNREINWSESWSDDEGRTQLTWTAVSEGDRAIVYIFWSEL